MKRFKCSCVGEQARFARSARFARLKRASGKKRRDKGARTARAFDRSEATRPNGCCSGRVLYLDYSHGVSGTMFFALLCDLGLNTASLFRFFSETGIIVDFAVFKEENHGLSGTRIKISGTSTPPLRRYGDLLEIVARLPFEKEMEPALAERVRGNAAGALQRLARAEEQTRGMASGTACLREADMLETLVLVVGVFWGLAALGIDSVTGGDAPWPSGSVATEHGTVLAPTPVTALLLQGKPVRPAEHDPEIITPLGALLVDQVVERFCDGPNGILEQCGYGLGSNSESPGLRGVLTVPDRAHDGLETVWVLETHIDHLTGEEIGAALELIMEQGALDVLFVPGLMKKGRPGGLLRVLCADSRLDRVERAVFHHTHTLGVRRRREERRVLQREAATLPVSGESVAAKRYTVDGGRFARAEYEALNALARRTGRSLPGLRFLMEE